MIGSNSNTLSNADQKEHYDRVNATLRDSSILIAGSSILFGFLLDLILQDLAQFTFFDELILLMSLYSVTISTAFFILPVIYHLRHYHIFNIEKFLLISKRYLLIGVVGLFITFYFGLAIALDSAISTYGAFGLALVPFAIVMYHVWRVTPKIQST